MSAFLTSRFIFINERKKFERELHAKMIDWDRDFSMKYAELKANDPKTAKFVGQQFADAYLLVDKNREKFFIPRAIRAIVGRDKESLIFIDDPSISRTHASIEHSGGEFWLTSLAVTSGTTLNGAKVQGRAQLSDGDEIYFGAVKAQFYLLGAQPPFPPLI